MPRAATAAVTPLAAADLPGSQGTPLALVGAASAPSWLSQRLEGGEHPDAVSAFRAAREIFIDGQRIDMGRLAARLGIDRTSLFRRVGNRDGLLSEVLWSLAVPTLSQADRASAGRGGAGRIVSVLTLFAENLITADYFRSFLRREPARGLRLLTTKESQIQRRYVAVVEHLVRTELGEQPLAPRELAYLLVRISESFTYADLITGDAPSAERARAAFELVLRP
jgi:AcrR family transcriptional regulator